MFVPAFDKKIDDQGIVAYYILYLHVPAKN